MRNFSDWGRAAAGLLALAALALGAGGCASVERSDVEQWYKEGHISQAEYEMMLQKINAGQAATPSPGAAPAVAPAAQPAP